MKEFITFLRQVLIDPFLPMGLSKYHYEAYLKSWNEWLNMTLEEKNKTGRETFDC